MSSYRVRLETKGYGMIDVTDLGEASEGLVRVSLSPLVQDKAIEML